MNQQQKDTWTTALESGDYNQTYDTLYRAEPRQESFIHKASPAGYCCLGVACKVFDLEYSYGQLEEFLKLDSATISRLANLNDKDKLDFKQIANYIKDNL